MAELDSCEITMFSASVPVEAALFGAVHFKKLLPVWECPVHGTDTRWSCCGLSTTFLSRPSTFGFQVVIYVFSFVCVYFPINLSRVCYTRLQHMCEVGSVIFSHESQMSALCVWQFSIPGNNRCCRYYGRHLIMNKLHLMQTVSLSRSYVKKK